MEKELQILKQLIDLSIKKGVFENMESILIIYQSFENIKKQLNARANNNNDI